MGAILEAANRAVADRPVLLKVNLLARSDYDHYFEQRGIASPNLFGHINNDRDRLVDEEAEFLVRYQDHIDRLPVVVDVAYDYAPLLHGPHPSPSGEWYWEGEGDQDDELLEEEPYLVLQQINGDDLNLLARDPKRFGAIGSRKRVRNIVRVARELSSLLGQFHTRTHNDNKFGNYKEYHVFQDLKPDNVLATHSLMLFLVDFGTVGRVMIEQRGKQAVASFLGRREHTPEYAAPEIASGVSEPSEATDLYTLGATLLHLMLGERPQPGNTDQQLTKAEAYPLYQSGLVSLARGLLSANPQDRLDECRRVRTDEPLVRGLIPRVRAIQRELA